MKNLVFTLCATLFVSLGIQNLMHAQPTNSTIKDVSMPAPNAAALGKYGDVPVSYFTGVPSIDIPIYTVQEGPLSLPISLSYHASGIKIGEPSSWVGMGWSLNAGGIISRTVLGRPDDTPLGYYVAGSLLRDPDEVLQPTHPDYFQKQQVADGSRDAEPDIFSYNVGGIAGKFLIDKDRIVQMMPRSDVKVEVFRQSSGQGNFYRIILTNTDGTRYIFGTLTSEAETSLSGIEFQYFAAQNSSDYAPSSWYLRRIETADGKFGIDIVYADDHYSYKSLSSSSVYYPMLCAGSISSSCGTFPIGGGLCADETTIKGKRVAQIISSTAIIDFKALTERDDLDAPVALPAPGGGPASRKRLDRIEIKNTGDAACSKKFEFTYSYMQSSGGTESFRKRLWLNQVLASACDNSVSERPWVFDYISGTLPSRLSKQVDHWGFYNGATNNESTNNIPPVSIVDFNGDIFVPPYATANRTTNETFLGVGTLNKVTYPTGGNTEFTYEANDYSAIVQTLTGYTWSFQMSNCTYPQTACCNNNQVDFDYTFGTTELQDAKFRMILTNLGTQFCNSSNPAQINIFAKRISDNTPVGSYGFNTTNSFREVELNVPDVFSLQSGVAYRFTLTVTNGKGNFEIRKPVYTSSQQNVKAGGLRIKQIKSHDGISTSNDVIKTYSYKRSSNPSESSGILYQKPIYVQYTWSPPASVPPYSSVKWGIRASATSTVPMTSMAGYHLGYNQVTEELNGNGKAVYDFLIDDPGYSGLNGFSDSLALTPPKHFSAWDGKEYGSKNYNQAGGIISSQSPSYENPSYATILGIVYKCTWVPVPGQGPCNAPSSTLIWREYQHRKGTFRPASVTETKDGVTTVTTFAYDATNRFLAPVANMITNSDGKVTKTEMKYPHDLPSGCIRDGLLQRNMIGNPWQTTVKVNDVMVSGNNLSYASFDNTTGAFSSTTTCGSGTFPRPYQFNKYEVTWNNGTITSGLWSLDGTINSYNAKGLAASYTATNWLPETYTWENSGVIKTRSYNGYTTTYDYLAGTRLVSKMTQPDGQEAWYDYDKLYRLVKTWARPSTAANKLSAKVTTDYGYGYRGQAPAVNPYGENFVKTVTTFATPPPAGSGSSSITSKEVIQYMDGLGRPYQTVNRKQSPAQKDVVSVAEYDKWGRVSKTYNPVESTLNTGDKLSSVPGGTPYSITEYYADPLNRPWRSTPAAWYPTTFTYGANVANEVILDHTASTFYAANLLTKTTTTDPNNNVSITFTDKKGRTILSRRTDAGNTASINTYNIYDDKDRPTKVMPPGSTFNSATLNFEYTYDGEDKILTKKVPDAAIITMKYNNRDQLALEQDGNLAAQSKWRCSQYDDFGRVVKSGLYSGTVTDPVPLTLTPTELFVESIYGTTGIEKGKIKQAKAKVLDVSGAWLQTTYNFDTYGRVSTTTGNNHLMPNDLNAESQTFIYDFADNSLSDSRSSKQSASVTNTIAQNFTYDHWGRLKSTLHGVNGAAQTTTSEMNYDWKSQMIEKNLGKTPTSHLQSLDFAYNAQGWLTTLNTPTLNTGTNAALGLCPTNPTAPAPATGTGADGNDLFYLDLKYDVLQSGLSGTIQKNGNISQAVWRTRGRERQSYSFTYDYLDRMTVAQYADINDAGTVSPNNNFREQLTYNVRGNITTLQRDGLYKTSPTATCWTLGTIDQLVYTYYGNTNRLSFITDNAPAASKANGWNKTSAPVVTTLHLYDANGNMKYDPAKGMDVAYNHLNLPNRMSWTNLNTSLTKEIKILYDGGGRKLQKRVIEENGTLVYQQDYVSGIEYRTTPAKALTLEAIPHTEGRVYNTNVTSASTSLSLRYEYTIKDHLGNARLAFTDKNTNGVVDVTNTAANEVLQENHYYPFGLNMSGPWMNDAALDNRYQYNGKELNDDFGLNWNDYGARWYDATVGRWWSVDPLAEQYSRWSGYCYGLDNPVRYIDPDGRSSETVNPQSLIEKDKKMNTNHHDELVADLQEKTGVQISIGTNGNWQVDNVDDSKGSATARTDLLKMINDESVVNLIGSSQGNYVSLNSDGTPSNNIHVDGSDITYFMENTIGMDNTTNGYAMVLLHEFQHTALGGGLKDTEKTGAKGPTVEKVNIMLKELGLPERESYAPMSAGSGTHDFIPYSKEAKKSIKKGVEPNENQPHVRISKLKAFQN